MPSGIGDGTQDPNPSCVTHSSGSRYSSSGGMAVPEAGSLERAMISWKLMSVWVLVSISWLSAPAPDGFGRGARRKTCTMMGSLAMRKASTAWSWVALDRSFPFTWRKQRQRREKKRAVRDFLSED